MAKLTTQDFIDRAHAVHDDRYEYSLVEYVNNNTKVKIICPEHGVFEQLPTNHWQGKNCIQCAKTQRAKNKTKNTDQFIEEARSVHGNKYDYSRVQYIRQNSEVQIFCPEHGEFTQLPKTHLRGHGCYECGLKTITEKKSKTTSDFIAKAMQVHGDRFDYSKVDYQGANNNVTIICPIHGMFEQAPSNHYAGKGCSACSGLARYDKERFIEKSRLSHGDKYDYSNVHLVNVRSKVEIRCPDHGNFLQEARHHMNGIGCPLCKGDSIRDALTKSTDEFISQAQALHGTTYDYSQVEYVGTRNNLTIICPEHGGFEQQPRAHLQGSGCPECGDIRTADSARKTTEQFIVDAIKVHGDNYDYSLVDYRGAFKKVRIICPEHGEFEQFAGRHLGGSNCPSCAYTGFDYNAPTILYYLRVETRNQLAYKIGITNNTVESRYRNPDRKIINIVKEFQYETGQEAYDREQEILMEYAEYKYTGDPLLTTGNTELFNHDILKLDNLISDV